MDESSRSRKWTNHGGPGSGWVMEVQYHRTVEIPKVVRLDPEVPPVCNQNARTLNPKPEWEQATIPEHLLSKASTLIPDCTNCIILVSEDDSNRLLSWKAEAIQEGNATKLTPNCSFRHSWHTTSLLTNQC